MPRAQGSVYSVKAAVFIPIVVFAIHLYHVSLHMTATALKIHEQERISNVKPSFSDNNPTDEGRR